MTVKMFCTLCGKEIAKVEGEDYDWGVWEIKIVKRPWGEPHQAIKTALDLDEVCDICADKLLQPCLTAIQKMEVRVE